MRFQFSGPPQKRGFGCACVLCLPQHERFRQPEAWAHSPRVRRTFSLHCEQPRQPEAWAHFPWMRRAFSLSGPSTRRWSGLRKSLDRNQGLFALWEQVASLGLSLPLSPPPCLLPPAGMGGLFSGVSQSLVLQTTGSVFGPVNFSLLSHSLKKLPPTALRAFGLVLNLSNAARSSLFRPHLLVAGASVWGTFLLGVAFRHVICGPYLISPPS